MAVSQYPHESECLFAPLTGAALTRPLVLHDWPMHVEAHRLLRTGIEMLSTRIDGTVLVIEARLSVNLNALTIEQAPALCFLATLPSAP